MDNAGQDMPPTLPEIGRQQREVVSHVGRIAGMVRYPVLDSRERVHWQSDHGDLRWERDESIPMGSFEVGR